MNLIPFPKMKTLTICAECRHFDRRGDTWCDHFCGHLDVRRGTHVDYVTGEQGFLGVNDQGHEYFIEEERPYAREINRNGECPYYEVIGDE